MNYQERKNVEVGQHVYLFYGDYRIATSRYSMPLPVISVTATQFTIAAEHMDSKPRRFMKSSGHEVGHGYSRSSPSVTLVTPQSKTEVTKFNNKKNAEARTLVNKEQQEENDLREKYNAVLPKALVDDNIQERFLKPLRTMAEDGEEEMSKLLESFDGVTLEAENFYRITDAVERETKNGYFAYGLKTRDYARNLHQRFVNMIEEFLTGTQYEINKVKVGDLEQLITAEARRVLSEQMSRFFDYTFSNTVVDEADQKFISTLRSMTGEDNRAPRITKIKEEG